ncbi:4a-hydroxytetrahydrobiopterin dehydratase [Natronocalculus amylovorans]|uniref:4a-hydroxytetrahydrobiopterin dehydratase n=1 Tax=Natronocalculus amylovorans TaxID=2917812 RepID=A0AAE3FWT0_9EURY|nr:4a-hydroxytetrahydrobiopterin dehydratase [Natronocalculus amylovorans]MCL9816636.1 4a-hydroxytetrahydrobiopterin dehydratase [Natronocalculus amylovorans]NUE01079.1 4a-hydroxytetrahydrobiopterin dehydratase [Halorubraceae archaeon YAN]
MSLLSDTEIADGLPAKWTRDDDEIVREYTFDSYLDGVEFAGDIGEVAEEEFHHPEIIIGYKSVEVRLTSHEAGGITKDDLRLAALFDDEY